MRRRSRSLRTPANIFIINLAVADLLMCVTQTPIFFTTSMHKRWIFGEKGSARKRLSCHVTQRQRQSFVSFVCRRWSECR